jgi:hypothetical protein
MRRHTRNGFLERIVRIKRTSQAWKARVLSLNYTRIKNRIREARHTASASGGFTLNC